MTIKLSKSEITKRQVTLCGIKPIMFDRYPGDNATKLEPHQKLYLKPDGSNIIGIPAANFISFLSAHNTNSAPKRLRDARKYKSVANAMLSFVDIDDQFIEFQRDGKPIKFSHIDDSTGECPESGVYVHHSVARLEKGIPNPKERPVLPCDWELSFGLSIFPNKEIKEQEIVNLIEEGGRAIGLGTYRGVFGKFYISRWD